jgi:homoserine kinase
MDGLPANPTLLQSAVTTGLIANTFTSGHSWRTARKTAATTGTLLAGQADCLCMQKVTVRVPGSTSNLGPGFDCLGVALCLHNSVTLVRDHARRFSHPRIVSEAAERFFKQARRRPFSFLCHISEQVPRSRGLGSSATVRLGVLLALNRLSGNPLDRAAIFRICAGLEGHPDNAAPATFGGFTVVQSSASVSVPRGKRGECRTVQRFDVALPLYFVLLVPDLEINTARARRILPPKVSRIAAVENCGNACAVTAAFASQDYEKLRGTFIDYLHQPFRSKLIAFLPRVIAAAERAGALGAFLSGSGSTIAAVTLRAPKKVATAMAHAASAPARTIITHADNHGARVSPTRSPHPRRGIAETEVKAATSSGERARAASEFQSAIGQ